MLKISPLLTRFRLIGGMIFLAALIIIGNSWVENILQIKNAQEILIREVAIANNVLTQDYARLLYTDDTNTAADIISKLGSFSMVLQADLYNHKAVNLLHFSRQTTDHQQEIVFDNPHGQFQGNELLISFPLVVNKKKIGEIVYTISTHNIDERTQVTYKTNMLMAVISVFVAILGAYFLQGIFIKKDLHINFLENLEKINDAIHSARNAEEMLNAVLKVVQEIFATDRAWLLYPCNPNAKCWHVPMEITKPEFPGALAQGEDIPMSDEVAISFRKALNNRCVECIDFRKIDTAQVIANEFSMLSEMHIALHPKIGDAWLFGVHQCAYSREWQENEINLFLAISQRLTDGLSSLLFLRDLTESEERNRSLLDSTAEAIYGLDLHGVCTFCNTSCLRMLGLSDQNELLGKKMHDLIHHTHKDGTVYLEKDCHISKAFTQNTKIHIDSEVIFRGDGSSFSAEYWSHPISKNDKVIGCVVTFIDISARKKQEEKLSYQASHDALTGLLNRYEFEQRILKLLELNLEPGHQHEQHAMCFLDLDQFKVVNDTCGHVAGDALLKQICQVLSTAIRKNDTLARIGGDEFAVLMQNCSLDHAAKVAANILDSINSYQFCWQGHVFRVGVSIGLIPINEASLSVSEILILADTACYVAKDSGRNQVHVYHAKDEDIVKHQGEMQWVTQIYQALDENRLLLYAQVIMPIKSNEQHYFELLLRMQDVQGRIIAPVAFLPAAERYDVVDQLDLWVLKTSFTLLAQSPGFLDTVKCVSINLSGKSLTKAGFLETVIELLEETKIEASKICFEITETAAIANLNVAKNFITTLKCYGFCFALDDFGSGFSSFAYLKTLPVDYLKIDGMFVKDIVEDPIDYEMVKSINNIGHVMGIKTIAEFVENDDILKRLTDIGIDYAQGYGIGKPIPLLELMVVENKALMSMK